MRQWEDEEAERARRKKFGLAMPDPKRKKNVRPSVRRIGEPVVAKKKGQNESKKEKKDKSTTISVKKEINAWKPMKVDKSSSMKNECWMSLDREGECGVEVACNVSTPRQSSTGVSVDQLKFMQDGSKSVKSRLLRSLSNTN